MLVYDRETVLQVVHIRGHGFQKVLPGRGAPIATHTRSTSEKPNQNPTRPYDKTNTRFRNISGGHPLSRSRNGVSKLRDGLKVCANGCKRLGTRTCGWACRYRVITPHPKQYSVLLAQS